MSKSKGNLVAPAKYFDDRRAPTPCACSTCSSGPPADDVDWSEQTDEVIDGCARFLSRVWRLATRRGGRRSTGRRPPPTGRPGAGHPPAHRPGHRRLRPLVVQHRGRRLHGVHQPALQARPGGHRAGVGEVRGRHPAAADGADGAPRHRRAVGAPPPGRARPRPSRGRRSTPSWPPPSPSPWSCRSTARCATASRSTPASTRPRHGAAGPGLGQGAGHPGRRARPTKVITRPPKLVNLVVES